LTQTSRADRELAAMKPTHSPAVWRLELLGGLSATSGTTTLAQFGSRKIAALLARLALSPQRTHSREELIDLLWPEADLPTGRNRLRHALSTLRRLLQPPGAGDVLVADRLGVRLNPQAVSCDAVEFAQLAAAGQAAPARVLYRGELLPGFCDEWIDQERLRLQALFERLADDRPAAAASLPAAPGVGMTLFPHRQVLLPSYLSAFFGREGERRALAARLAERRLVTLSGPGGSGKTRLAVEVAREIAGRFEAVLFVGLAEAVEPARLFEAIQQVLHLPAGGRDAPAQVLDFLCEREALLVLDNFEQLVPQGSGIVEQLLADLPRLRCLVTSRRVLSVDGELEIALAPLPVPEEAASFADLAANPSVALFVDRARGARAEFQVTQRNAADVARVVEALEGVPLAIELAASRIRSMSVSEMARHIGIRRDWVARRGGRARAARHVSLHAAIDWSWRLLSTAQQRFLAGLTEFRGGFTPEAAAAVGARPDALDLLDSLVADSLLQTQTDAWGSTRFSMLEMIREFVAGQADAAEVATARERHRRHFLAQAQRQGRIAADRLAADLANVEQALATSLDDGDIETALELAMAIRPFADARGLGARLVALLQRLGDDAAADDERRCRVHMLLAEVLTIACRLDDALAHARRAVELAPAELLRAEAAYVLARADWDRNLTARAHRPALEQALGVARAAAAAHLQARALNLLGVIAMRDEGDVERAEGHFREALDIARRADLRRLATQGQINLGVLARRRRNVALALHLNADVIDGCRERGDHTLLADALHDRGLLLIEMRRWAEAVSALRECVEFCWRHRALITLLYALWNIARPLARAGGAEEAAQAIGFAAAYWERHGGPLSAQDRRYVRRVEGLAAAQLGGGRVAAALREGAALALPDAVALVLQRSAER
jgi:predicted ATPase